MHVREDRLVLCGVLLATCVLSGAAPGGDWPMWRCDPNRSARAADALPGSLRPQWILRKAPLVPAWPDEPRMRFDAAYQPVVKDRTLYVGSSRDGSVRALDVETGRQRWCFFADGPVRFAPVAWEDALYFVSDDGHLYCLDAAAGRLRWKHRGGPSDRKVLGNERLISMWPARGAPVVYDGKVYFAAGIWPFMGVFLYALDARSGQVLWCNDGDGSIYLRQPHDSPAFAGIAPQGYIVATADRLLVPNGRAAAAAFDRHTGRLLFFPLAKLKRDGHYHAAAAGGYFVNSGQALDPRTGKPIEKAEPRTRGLIHRYHQSARVVYDPKKDQVLGTVGEIGVLDGPLHYQSWGDWLVAAWLVTPTETYTDKDGKRAQRKLSGETWRLPTKARPMAQAGNRLYAADGNDVIAIELPPADTLAEAKADLAGEAKGPSQPRIAWTLNLAETPDNMIAAAERLFVVTREGGIHCLGAGERARPDILRPAAPAEAPADPADIELARDILQATGASEGYCLVLGLADGDLARQLVRQSALRVIALDADAAKVDGLRRWAEAAGVDGRRLSAIVADPRTAELPAYLASLVVSEDAEALARVPLGRLLEVLRPYGGTLCAALPNGAQDDFAARLGEARLVGAECRQAGRLTLLSRRGPLPGAGTWTHQYGDAANTGVSADRLVRAPLGLLWFGGPSNEGILPRHSHGPPEQVVAGRLFIEGPDLLRALDVYTGRLLWQRELPGVGEHYDHLHHEPGANALGTNFVATGQGLYVVYQGRCLRLDPATGQTVGRLALPADDPAADPPQWGYIAAWRGLLIAGGSPMKFWSPDFCVSEKPFRATEEKSSKLREAYLADVRKLEKEVAQWMDFQPGRPNDVLFVPASASSTAGPTTRPADECDRLVAGLNHVIRRPNILAKLPAKVVAAARAKDPERLKKWRDERDKAEDKGDTFTKPRPVSIAELEAQIASGAMDANAGDDDIHRRWINREVLQVCYPALPTITRPHVGQQTLDATASAEIVVMDPNTGRTLWRRKAAAALPHNSIAVGGGMLFCIDRLPLAVANRMLRRGQTPAPPELLALDVRTGKEIWSTRHNITGTWLSYSGEHDVLLQASRPSRDALRDETSTPLVAYRGKTGEVLWDKATRYSGPCLLHGRQIIAQTAALDLLTGETVNRAHPLTGEEIKWEVKRYHGCGTAIACEHLLTFRSAAAGFFDLDRDGGTANLGGFKSGCTSNLVAADGVLNAPDYTRTCTCSYQNRTSLALVHMPEVEVWTFQDFKAGKEPIRRVGLNLGAPGDHRADGGTLWLEYPIVGGPSPKLDIELEPNDPNGVTFFRRHSSRVAGGPLPWVAASGAEGLTSLSIRLDTSKTPAARTCTVSLHFAEPGSAEAGQRVFDVDLQDKTVLRGLDVAAEAGRPLVGLVKTFKGVQVASRLTIRLTPTASAKVPRPVLCGVEIVVDGPMKNEK